MRQSIVEAGGCLLSVDLSQAFDRVNRAKLDRARAVAKQQVDADLRSTVTAIHERETNFIRLRLQPHKVSDRAAASRRRYRYGPFCRPRSCGTSRQMASHLCICRLPFLLTTA